MSDFLSFRLPDDFVKSYSKKKPQWGFDIGGGNSLGELTFLTKYSRRKADGSKERWHEACRRVVEGYYSILKDHCKSNQTPWNENKAQKAAQDAYDRMFTFKWTPPGRGLWMMGTEFVNGRRDSAALQNCFAGSERFLTSEYGVISFEELAGLDVTVLTKNGWKSASVQEFGTQTVQSVQFKPHGIRSNRVVSIQATADHRWILQNGTHTTDLAVGDIVQGHVASPEINDEYWNGLVHGMIFGDGNKITHRYLNGDFGFELRACDFTTQALVAHPDVQNLFDQISNRPSCGNDPVAKIRTAVDLKKFPESPTGSYAKGFLEGWIAADASVSPNGATYKLASQHPDAYGWLDSYAALAGYTLNGVNADPVMQTNYGTRKSVCYRFSLTEGAIDWKVVSVVALDSQPVYCAVVPSEAAFTLASGIYTGNCAFISTEKLSNHSAAEATLPFIRLMEMSMLGVGVGFDTKGAGKLTVHSPTSEEKLIQISDDREGWYESVGSLLESYFFQNRATVTFDYSLVRPAGEPIKGFGGVAAGPTPLIRLHERLRKLLDERAGSVITSSDIVDIMNLIGKCVVAGNVRRSAEIALGRHDDEAFLDLKDWNVNPERMGDDGWGHISNNSIFAEIGMDYSGIESRVASNGEPGLLYMDLCRSHGRLVDPPNYADHRAAGTNPCFHGDTLIAVADGRGAVPIRDLAEEGRDVPVYSLTPEGKVEIQWGRNPRLTRENAELVRVTLNDGTHLDVTPDHKFVLRDGTKKTASELQPNDSLPAFTKRAERMVKGGKKYLRVDTDTTDPQRGRIMEHRMVARFEDPDKWDEIYDVSQEDGWSKGGLIVHHRDFNSLNNASDNLEIISFRDHQELHAKLADVSGDKNPMWDKRHSDAAKALIGAKTRERCEDPRFRRSLSDSHTEEKRTAASERMSVDQRERLREYYLEQAEATDLDTVWVGENLHAIRYCESCGDQMVLPWRRREVSFCSRSCVNRSEAHTAARRAGLRGHHESRSAGVRERQIDVYLTLQVRLGRDPLASEWRDACKKAGVSARFQKNSPNPNVFKRFLELKEVAAGVNHRVVSVTPIASADVYNITVDGNHTVGVVTDFDASDMSCSGILTFQCGEQTLESYECCTLVETFPFRHDSLEDYKKTLKQAYLYAKAVTLLPTHWPETNEVMQRNRRIGCSMSGVVQFVERHGWTELRNWTNEGYKAVVDRDRQYSEWLGVRESVKKTSIKPSGTVSILAGATPGAHWMPGDRFHIRRQRYAASDPMVPYFVQAGYHVEPEFSDPEHGVVVEFFTEAPDVRKQADVSVWEKASLAILLQRYWADNQVSVTLTFTESERDQIGSLLSAHEGQLKSVSFLPIVDGGAYRQMPYEDVTKERHDEAVANVKPIDWKSLYSGVALDAEGEKFCNNDVCTI